jgi:putative PIN family toxin of toxin-antitoxin system
LRIFLDTNVLASALTTRGLCADVLQRVIEDYELVTGEIVIEELLKVLSRKFDARMDKLRQTDRFLRRFHVEPKPRLLPDLDLSERNDLIVIGSAINAKAEILITGDHEMLALKKKPKDLRIINPREFWNFSARILS